MTVHSVYFAATRDGWRADCSCGWKTTDPKKLMCELRASTHDLDEAVEEKKDERLGGNKS